MEASRLKIVSPGMLDLHQRRILPHQSHRGSSTSEGVHTGVQLAGAASTLVLNDPPVIYGNSLRASQYCSR